MLSMQDLRWYAAAEALADGTIVLIGSVVRLRQQELAQRRSRVRSWRRAPTYEFYPSRGPATVMNFMITTSGLNSYAHTYLMPSGNLLVQANLSTSELPSVRESGP